MELDHRPLEFLFQVEVQVEQHSNQEVTELLVVVEPTTGPMAVQELQDKDLLVESHRAVVEVVEVEVLAKLVTPMAKVMVVMARSVQ
jgi:hypothetical protein